MTAIAGTTAVDHAYPILLHNVQLRLVRSIVDGAPLFTTNTPDLYTVYLDALPAAERQHNRCHACRQFVNAYGGLVTITEDGDVRSALWHADDAPGFYRPAVHALRQAVERAPVAGVFYSSASIWGTPITGVWRHLAAAPPSALVWTRPTQTAAQAMAERREDYRTLARALVDFTPTMLQTAVGLLQSEALYRSEKVLGVAQWLLALHERRAANRGPRRDNILWRAVATAPAGYCHPRSSMIGTLLEDIAAGLSFEQVKRRFGAKMHPLSYQRPQAAPRAGNIAQAEKLIAQLEAAGALQRRYARLDDIQTLWEPEPMEVPAPTSASIFGHLRPDPARSAQSVHAPPVTMTWEKFQRTVLPVAREISFHVPRENSNYAAFVTAVDPAAPLIFQWSNPVSWYLYAGGSPPENWGLSSGAWRPVAAVALQPNLWGEKPMAHQGAGVLFVLAGAVDRNWRKAGAGLFPEFLRSEFHGVRATIEAYSKQATIAGVKQADACGLLLGKGRAWSARFRVVTTGGLVQEYVLDRWD